MKKILLLLVTAVLLFGCSKDEEGNLDNGKWNIVLNETIINESKTVYKTETFAFDHNQLLQRSIYQQVMESEINYETNLNYSDHKVVVTNTDGLALTYFLNDKGYANKCTYETPFQKRKYLFTYSSDDYLTKISESIDNEMYSTTIFTYEEEDLTSVTSSINGISNKINYQAGKEESTDYYFPCLNLLETYPLTIHIEALYAGLLGASPRHLTIRTNPQGNSEEYTTYNYEFDDKGSLKQIESKTIYSSGGNYHNYYPNQRKISITIR